MAIPLWRQYSRLSREDRDAILQRRRRRLNDASNRREVLDAFLADARDVRARYAGRNSTRPEADTPDSGSAGSDFASPATIAAAERLGIRPNQVAAARNAMAADLEQDFTRRQQSVPASQRTRFRRPSDQELDDALARRFNR